MAPVHDAAEGNDVEALQRLLDANPQLSEAADPCPPLYHACRAGAAEAAQCLLDRGASTTWAGNVDLTPLFGACYFGHDEIVEMLLAHGADPAVRNSRGQTVLMVASYGYEKHGSDHVAAIRLLLKDGRVPVDARDHGGCTALCWAFKTKHLPRAGSLLLGSADLSSIQHRRVGDGGEEVACEAHQGFSPEECMKQLMRSESALEKPFLLSKARALVDATESITKAPKKMKAKKKEAAQKAREEAAPAYLQERVRMGMALPVVKVMGVSRKRSEEEVMLEQERRAVCEYVVRWMKEDLFVEMMLGLRYL